MPIILYSKAERIPLHIPPIPPPLPEAQAQWPALKAQWLAAQEALHTASTTVPAATREVWQEALATLTILCIKLDELLQPPADLAADEAAVFYFHRLLPDEREKLKAATTERGDTNWALFWSLAAQEGTDGWDVGPALVDADLQPLAVPIATSQSEQRRLIANLIQYFPPSVQQQLGVAAIGESPAFLLNAWQKLYRANSSSATGTPGMNTPASTVGPNTQRKDDAPPATERG